MQQSVRVWRLAGFAGIMFAGVTIGLSAVAAETQQPETSLAEVRRVPWPTSRVVGSPEPPPPYRTAPLYEKLSIPQPVYAAAEPGTSNLFVIQLQQGKEPARIHRVADRNDVSTTEPLLSLEKQLVYGLTFHPQYADNGYCYVYSNGPVGDEHKFNRISRFTVPKEPGKPIDPASELVIITWESNGHNGGEPGFGPDGMLYAATGDGTSDSDPLETGQGVNDLLAVMLRLDVDHPTAERPYSIPPDNPYVNVPDARGEIWAFGFRNPWRMTFDRKTGQLWVTQNGQDLWEQVYLVRRAENYGWSVQEGSYPFYLNRPKGPGEVVPPVAEHHHTEARSLTGGVVYYGSKLPELQGAYIYGDYSTGRIWGIRHNDKQVTWHQEICDTPFAIVGFVETPSGELAVIDQHSGFHRLEPAPPVTNPLPFPQTLSETGLYASVADHAMAPGVIGYSVNSPLWSDGAHKERYLALPGMSQVDFTPTQTWQLPEATVLVKTFSLELEAGNPVSRRRIETRIMTRQQNEWAGYTYAWNDEQTEATLVERGGQDRDFVIRDATVTGGERTQTWHFPSRSECMICHSRAARFVLGVCTEQLNRTHQYPEGEFQQLEYLSQLGMLRAKIQEHPGAANQWKQLAALVEQQAGKIASFKDQTTSPLIAQAGATTWQALRTPPQNLPWLSRPVSDYTSYPDPADESQPLEARVRSYLHVNCATCHQGAGGGNSQIELRFTTAADKRNLLDVAPLHDKFQIANARLIAPGDPGRSVLLHRMQIRGRGQMPPLATSLVDPVGTAVLQAWIQSLPQQTARSE